ncbi:MAG: hypothetical protein SF028_09150 [Candidatus Sumerlaeia bacterium]|nr:hypothetical protein [Candidatus Sumerlaeia bacterium]
MNALLANIVDNPILTRELRRRMRKKELIYSVVGYIIALTVATLLVLFAFSPGLFQSVNTRMLEQLANTGTQLFRWITVIQVLLVLIIAPTITAGMTTGEKERKTFDFLRVTTITPWMYVTGCFLSTVFYVALALTCAFPLLSLVFVYGGVASSAVFGTFGLLLGGSLVLSSFGLYVSSIRDRTRTAQGIIVFAIFAAGFGGIYLYNQLQVVFGAGAAGGGQAASTALGNLGLPLWAVAAFLILLVTAVFLLLAARKLFEPESTRAFTTWQFLAFSSVVMVPMTSVTLGAQVSEPLALAFLATGTLLLTVAIYCFAVGRMEVGDETWHLKRLVPALRPFDGTLLFLVLVGVIWWYTLELFLGGAVLAQSPKGLLDAFGPVSLASFFALCAVGRWATAVAVGRSGAGRMVGGVMAGLWLGLPVVGASARAFLEGSSPVTEFLIHLSPFYLLFDSLGEPELYASASVAVPAVAGFYTVAGLAVLAVGEYLRHRRWKGFDYHYDMPAR